MGTHLCHSAPVQEQHEPLHGLWPSSKPTRILYHISAHLLHAWVVPMCCALTARVWQAFSLSRYLVADPNVADLFLVPAVMYCLTDGKVINFTGAQVSLQVRGCDAVIVQVHA